MGRIFLTQEHYVVPVSNKGAETRYDLFRKSLSQKFDADRKPTGEYYETEENMRWSVSLFNALECVAHIEARKRVGDGDVKIEDFMKHLTDSLRELSERLEGQGFSVVFKR